MEEGMYLQALMVQDNKFFAVALDPEQYEKIVDKDRHHFENIKEGETIIIEIIKNGEGLSNEVYQKSDGGFAITPNYAEELVPSNSKLFILASNQKVALENFCNGLNFAESFINASNSTDINLNL